MREQLLFDLYCDIETINMLAQLVQENETRLDAVGALNSAILYTSSAAKTKLETIQADA